jgi:hypothetical protein
LIFRTFRAPNVARFRPCFAPKTALCRTSFSAGEGAPKCREKPSGSGSAGSGTCVTGCRRNFSWRLQTTLNGRRRTSEAADGCPSLNSVGGLVSLSAADIELHAEQPLPATSAHRSWRARGARTPAGTGKGHSPWHVAPVYSENLASRSSLAL